MEYEINHNFSGLALGETCCYHVGNLAADRVERNGRGFSDSARLLQTISGIIYNRSCMPECTGEFELKQVRIGNDNYAYLAKRVKEIQ